MRKITSMVALASKTRTRPSGSTVKSMPAKSRSSRRPMAAIGVTMGVPAAKGLTALPRAPLGGRAVLRTIRSDIRREDRNPSREVAGPSTSQDTAPHLLR